MSTEAYDDPEDFKSLIEELSSTEPSLNASRESVRELVTMLRSNPLWVITGQRNVGKSVLLCAIIGELKHEVYYLDEGCYPIDRRAITAAVRMRSRARNDGIPSIMVVSQEILSYPPLAVPNNMPADNSSSVIRSLADAIICVTPKVWFISKNGYGLANQQGSFTCDELMENDYHHHIVDYRKSRKPCQTDSLTLKKAAQKGARIAKEYQGVATLDYMYRQMLSKVTP